MLTDLKKNNYIYSQCRRGMLELDEILLNFFNNNYYKLSKTNQQTFELLLQENDADLFSWLFGGIIPENTLFQNLILLIKQS